MRWVIAALCMVLAAGMLYLAAQRYATTQKRFADTHIVFIMGGVRGQEFSDSVYRGVRDAQRDFGCDVKMKWTEWDEDLILRQLSAAVAMETPPDGICLIGFPSQEKFGPIVDEAVRKGITVTTLNTAVPELMERYHAEGLGFAGQDGRSAGLRLASKAVLKFGLKEGDRALLLGSMSLKGRAERAAGCLEGMNAAKLIVDTVDFEIERKLPTPRGAQEVVSAYLQHHPDLRLVVLDNGDAGKAAKALQDAGKKPGEIGLAAFDATASQLGALESGYLGLTLDQQEYLEGYMPVLQICLARSVGIAGLHIETTGRFIDASNLEMYKQIAARRAP